MRRRAVGAIAASVLTAVLGAAPPSRAVAALSLDVLPQPRESYGTGRCALPLARYVVRFDGVPAESGALAILGHRWHTLGIPARPGGAVVTVSRLSRADAGLRARLGEEGYVVRVDAGGVQVEADTSAGRFYGLMTLAQLPMLRRGGAACLPGVRIVDWPAMRWRGLSDDVSRGPIPTMAFLRERIREVAAFKGNLYSLYFESAFRDPEHPLPAPPEAITPRELRTLSLYAARFHVALMPEQETLGHMHRLLSYERYAGLAAQPHGYGLNPGVRASEALVRDFVEDEGAQVRGRTPFFHLGGDEPQPLSDAAYLGYYAPLFAQVRALGMRPVIWSDVLLAHPAAIARLPKDVVVANWHYAPETSYERYLQPFASAGIEQLVAPGAGDWGQIFADATQADANAAGLARDGQATKGVIGLLESVWNDDGQSLFSNTWYPVLFALCAAWQPAPIDPTAFHERFAWAFFGTRDPRLVGDIDDVVAAQDDVVTQPTDPSNYLFWVDPFRTQRRVFAEIDLAEVRLSAERALRDLELHPQPPPLHADALPALRLAALRYDFLGRKFQIAREFDAYYADALAHAGQDDDRVFHDLFQARYLLWEWRDDLTAIRAAYARAWSAECWPAYLPNVLARYDEWRGKVLAMVDRLQVVTRERYYREGKTLPTRAELFARLDVGNEAP